MRSPWKIALALALLFWLPLGYLLITDIPTAEPPPEPTVTVSPRFYIVIHEEPPTPEDTIHYLTKEGVLIIYAPDKTADPDGAPDGVS